MSKDQAIKLQKQHQARKNLEVSTHSSNVRLLIHTTLAFANVTSGLGTGIRKNATPGPSSKLLDSTMATSDPQPAAATSDSDPQPTMAASDLQLTAAASDPQPAAATSDLQSTMTTSDPQPTSIVSAIPEISTVHLIHIAATCRFRVSQMKVLMCILDESLQGLY